MTLNELKIITHPGVFHADEIAAKVVLEEIYGFLPTERRKPDDYDLKNPNVFVLDVGGDYNPELNNYDHHQDSTLPASNLLVWREFVVDIVQYYYKDVDADKFSYKVQKYIMEFISDVDTGKIKNESHTPSISQIVTNLNNVSGGWYQAIELMRYALRGAMNTAAKAVRGEQLWETLSEPVPGFKLQTDTTFIPEWKSLAKRDGYYGMIQPNTRNPEQWQVVSRDTDEIVLPEAHNAVFRHNSGFMIVFKTYKEAEDYVQNILS